MVSFPFHVHDQSGIRGLHFAPTRSDHGTTKLSAAGGLQFGFLRPAFFDVIRTSVSHISFPAGTKFPEVSLLFHILGKDAFASKNRLGKLRADAWPSKRVLETGLPTQSFFGGAASQVAISKPLNTACSLP